MIGRFIFSIILLFASIEKYFPYYSMICIYFTRNLLVCAGFFIVVGKCRILAIGALFQSCYLCQSWTKSMSLCDQLVRLYPI